MKIKNKGIILVLMFLPMLFMMGYVNKELYKAFK